MEHGTSCVVVSGERFPYVWFAINHPIRLDGGVIINPDLHSTRRKQNFSLFVHFTLVWSGLVLLSLLNPYSHYPDSARDDCKEKGNLGWNVLSLIWHHFPVSPQFFLFSYKRWTLLLLDCSNFNSDRITALPLSLLCCENNA